MEKLEKSIGYAFRDRNLLQTALTHTSYANEKHNPLVVSYERLEFLGDSILGFTAADFLYRHNPPIPEGKMTRLRAQLVCEANLHKVALRLGLSAYMRIGKGEEHTGGRGRISVLADMVESIIAAIYLDGGLEQAQAFIMREILADADLSEDCAFTDYKSEFQERVQVNHGAVIRYELLSESGPDHNKLFTFGVYVNDVLAGTGSGRTKKEAEQQAACEAMKSL